MYQKTPLTEIYFDDENLTTRLRDTADWIDKHEMKYRVRQLFIEYSDERDTWYVNLILYGKIDEFE